MRAVLGLALWEWFKLQRRWMLWILLAFAILFGQLAIWGSYVSYRDLERTGGEVIVPAALQQPPTGRPRTVACSDLLSDDPARQPEGVGDTALLALRFQCQQQAALLPDRLQRAYERFTLPGSVDNALGTLQTLGLILMAILVASAIGIDYGTGTLRSVLIQGTGRWPYLAAKLLALCVVAALGLVVACATVAASSLVAASLATDAAAVRAPTSATWGEAGAELWRSWTSFLPYLTFTALVTILARSSAAGMAIGLGYYFAEQIAVALLSTLFSWFQNVADLLLVRNISAWLGGGGFGPGASALPDQTHALVVLSAYTLAMGALAFWLFERRDVQGPTAVSYTHLTLPTKA